MTADPTNRRLAELQALIEGENNLVGVLANLSAALHEMLSTLWTGFYLVEGEELLLGPFQGPVACYRIKKGRGVCGTAWDDSRPIIVPDVEQFPGHIACSSRSRSEIVVPVYGKSGRVAGVIDIDDEKPGRFNMADLRLLEGVAEMLRPYFD